MKSYNWNTFNRGDRVVIIGHPVQKDLIGCKATVDDIFSRTDTARTDTAGVYAVIEIDNMYSSHNIGIKYLELDESYVRYKKLKGLYELG